MARTTIKVSTVGDMLNALYKVPMDTPLYLAPVGVDLQSADVDIDAEAVRVRHGPGHRLASGADERERVRTVVIH